MANHRSLAARHDLVNRWLASSLPTHEFAAREDVSPSSLYRWRRLADEAESTPTPDAFVEIAVTNMPSAAAVEIDFGDATIRLRPGFDAASLATVLDALRAIR